MNYQHFTRGYLKYLAVPEIQNKREAKTGFGVWHYHVIFFNMPFIDQIYDQMREIWGKGYTLVKTVKNTHSLANYFSKYLSKQNFDYRLFGRKKYFCSKGLKKPYEARDMDIVDFIRSTIGGSHPIHESRFQTPEFHQETEYKKYKITDIQKALDWL